MVKSKTLEDDLSEDIYLGGKSYLVKLFLASIFFLFLGFLLNYPIKKNIEKKILGLLSNRACPIQYEKLKISTFPPSIKLIKPTIPPRCHGMANNRIALKNISKKLTRPSFYPPGLRFHTEIREGKSRINAYPSISLTKHTIKIEKSKIDSSLINKFIGRGNILAGSLNITSLINLQSSLTNPNNISVSTADILIKSKDLGTNSYNLGFFELPQLAVGKVQIKGSFNKKSEFIIKEFSLGDSSSPIIASFKGKIVINKKNINNSDLDLSGEVKFSKQFSEQVPIGIFLMGKKPDQNGFFKIKLGGKLRMPKPTFL